MTDKLRFATLALRRRLASDHAEVMPVGTPGIVSYGDDERALSELALALSELPQEARPTSVARFLLPEGVRLEELELTVARPDLPGPLARGFPITLTIAIIPDARPDEVAPGAWVFVPVLGHACYVGRREDLARRLTDELSRLPAALALGVDDWRRLISHAPAELVPLDIELATTSTATTAGRLALADAERIRLATLALDGAGRRHEPSEAPVIGRDAVIDELGRALAGPRRGVLLVGDEAAGKSAVFHAWARASRRPIWSTSAADLVAGASGLGEWQDRVASVLLAAETLDAVLYFDDFGALFADRPGEGGVELGAALRRHVVDGRVRIIGELTPAALDRAERRDVSLIAAMLRIVVPPTDVPTTVAACLAWAAHWRATAPHRPQIAAAALAPAVELARRYLPYRAFPGKAIRLLEDLRAAHDTGRDARGAGPELGEPELHAAFSWSTGIPIALLADDRSLPQSDIIAALRRRMVGQATAVRRVAEAISVAKARLAPADKPLASLLFVGPSGVGKTELARSVAAYLFGAPDRMVRLDMSEYTDPWAAERLFGAGDEDGRLTAAVRSQPFGVVLLDEIEKAHGSVFDLLLQVLGEARLTDGRGRTTYFHNAIIVLTSNLGTRGARGRLGLIGAPDDDRDERRYRDAVLAAFRPELINRLDQIVVFHPLAPDEIADVARIAVERLAERRGLTHAGVTLDVSPAALAHLADRGFSAELGARALRRHLETAVLGPSARLLAKAGRDGHGGTLTVRAPDDEPADRNVGARLGALTDELTVTLWRRAASAGRRMTTAVQKLGGLRRDCDAMLARAEIAAVRDKLAEIEGTLATATRKRASRHQLPGTEIARLTAEHARLRQRLAPCDAFRQDVYTAEELALEALAGDVDAIDLVDGVAQQKPAFEQAMFWALTALRRPQPGATLIAHSPDARGATAAWVGLMVAAARHHGWRIAVHTWDGPAQRWTKPSNALTGAAAPAVLVRVTGSGADLLLGLEAGLQRMHTVTIEPSHVWVDALEPRAEFTEDELAKIALPQTRAVRGEPIRIMQVDGERTLIDDADVEIPWPELPARLAEAALHRLLAADDSDKLWTWSLPVTGEGTP